MIRAKLPDGRTLQFPDGTDDDVIQRAVNEVLGVDQFADERTALGQAGETLKAIPRGFANTFLSAGEGLAELADAATNVVGLEDVIDSGDDNALVAASREGRKAIDEYLGADQAYQDTWLTKFGEGVGSLASFFTPAGALRLAGLAGKPVAALGGMGAAEAVAGGTLAAGAGAGDQAQRIQAARDAGIDVSENQEDLSIVSGGFVGLSELALPATLLKRLNPDALEKLPVGATELLKSALRSGSLEAIQEVSATIAQNAIEKGVYNEQLELLGGNLYDDLTIGGAVGAGADLVVNAIAGRRNKASFDAQLEKEKAKLEQNEKNIQARSEALSADLELDQAFQETLRQERENAPTAEEERFRVVRERIGQLPIGEQASVDETASGIKQLMGIYFPSANSSFSVRDEPVGQDGVKRYQVVDSEGYTYAEPSETQGRAAALASALNKQVEVDAVYNGGDAVIQSSPEMYSDDQKKTLQRYNFAANDPDAQTFTSAAIDSAAETTFDRGFYEGEKLEDVIRDVRAGVRQEARMTASQKINRQRLLDGKAASNNFTLQEAKDVLGDKLVNLTDTRVNGLPETESYRVEDRRKRNATVPNYVVVSSAGEVVRGRKLNPQEKQAYLETGRPKKNMPRIVPFGRNAGEAQAFADKANANTGIGRVDESVYRDKFVSRQFLQNVLDAKNITSPIDSPELKYLAERFAGVAPDTNLSQMTEGEFKLFAQKLRSLPRFDSPTKLPVFKLKPYTGYQFKKAVETLQRDPNASAVTVAEESGITDLDSANQVISDVQAQGVTEQTAPVALLPSPAPIDEAALDRFRAAMEREMKGLGLSDVPVNVDYALRSSSRDADGNVVYGIRPRQPGEEVAREDVVGGDLGSRTFVRQEEADPEGKAAGLVSQGYFSPDLNRIFLSVDAVKTDPSMTEEQVEAALISTLNHESVHAMRMMDLFKVKEWNLLSKKAKELKKSGNQTYLNWARENYKELNPVQQNEEAVAELVRDQRANPKIVAGKPRALLNRIRQFMVKLKNALDGSGFTSFDSIIQDISTGRIGARSRDVRTIQLTERRAGLASYAPTGTVRTPTSTTTGAEEEGRLGQPRMADFSRRAVVAPEPVEMGVNVRTDGDTNYADLIVSGQKKYESRDKDSLRPYVGKRVGIVETGSGPAKLVGYATVGEPIEVGEAEFDDSRDQHLVPEGSKFDIKPGQSKFLYEMIGPEKLAEPVDVSSTKGIVARNISQINQEEVSRVIEQVPETPFARTAPLSPLGQAASIGMTNTNLLPTQEELKQMKDNTYKPQQKRTLVEAAQFLQDRWQNATGRTEPFEYIPENIDILSDMLATEALVALENDANAIGWYDSKIKAAKAVMQLVEPQIMQSPDTEAVFDFGLAVTSNGQAVVDNFEMATDIFRYHMKNGRFPETTKEFNKGGERNAAMLEAFKFHNEFSKSGQNQAIRDFLDEDFTVRELSAFADDFNAEVGFDAIKVPSAEGADVVVKGSYILGPKIGQGFYQNIRGNYDPLTMDIWWMRMWNRAIGRPFTDGLGDEARVERRNELKNLVKKTGGLPRKLINEVLKGNDQTRTEVYQDPQLFDEFIRDVERRYQRFYKEYKAEKGVNHVKPEIFKKTGTYVKNMAPQLQATPKGVVERAYMREVVDAAKERLRQRNYNISTADFQALMWYPEKQLFRALGVQPGRGSDNDYLDAAEILAEKEGVPRGRVEKALRDADRKRADDDQPSARRQDGVVRPETATVDRQEEGPAFSRAAPRLESKRIPEGKVKEVVEQNISTAESAPTGFVPKFNPSADPYAQAVAADPDKGAVLPPEERAMFSRANAPERPEYVQSAMDNMLIANPEDETPGDTYLNALDQGPIDQLLTRAKQGAIFQYAQIEAYENKFDRDVLASSAAIPALMAADRSNAIAAQAIANGVPVYENGLTKVVDFEHTFTENSDRAGETVKFDGLIDVMGMLFTKEHGSLEEDAQAYAIAKRAQGLRARGIDSPGTPEQHRLVIENAEQYLDENGNSIIKDWYDAWQSYNRNTIKFLRDTGVLTEEMAEIWAAKSDYVPFYRQAMGEDLTSIPNMFNNLTSVSTFKPITGSEKQLNVPLLDAVVMNLNAAIDMGMKNVAQQRVVRNMVRYGMSSEIPQGEAVDGRPTVSFRVNGKDRKFTIEDPLVYQSLQPLAGGNGFDILDTVLGAPANLLREMVTREPGFILANMMRDTLSAYVTSGANFVPVASTLKGFTEDMTDLERTGVVGGYDYSKDPKDIGKYLNNLLKERGFVQDTTLGVAKPFIGLWNFMGDVTTRSDFATRKAVYDDVLARTGDEAEAVFQAKEVMNFGRRGSHPVMRLLTTAIPFLNARLQGLDLLLNAARGKRNANKNLDRGQAARSFIMRGSTIAAVTAMYYMMVSDDEQYKEQTEEIKDNFWIVPGPNGVAFRYPIPFEVGLIFKTIPERILRYATDDATARETAASLGRGIVSTLEINPFGVQAVAPAIEVLANYSAYRGRPITPVFIDQGDAQEFQETIGTSELAKLIGQTLGVSPIKTDYLIRGYTGTIGSYLLDTSDLVLRSKELQGDNQSVMPAMRITEYPVIKRFFTNEFGGAEKERFYEMSNYINRFYNSYNDLAKAGRLEELERFAAGRENLLSMKRDVDRVRRDLSALRKEREAVMRQDITPEEKQRLVREINLRERYVLDVVPELYKLADLPTIDVGSRLRAISN